MIWLRGSASLGSFYHSPATLGLAMLAWKRDSFVHIWRGQDG